MLDKSLIVAECANSVKPCEAGGPAMVSVPGDAADVTAAGCLVCKELLA